MTIEDAWKAYKGQIYWYSPEGLNYPLAPIDPVLEDAETDGRIKKWRRKTAANNFNLQHYFIHKGKFENENERDVFIGDVKAYQGDEAATVCVIDLEVGEQSPEIVSVPQPDGKNNFYVANEQGAQECIRQRFSLPPPLIGIATSGKLGSSQEIQDAVAFANGMTNQERRLMEETFQRIFSYWYNEGVNPSNDYSIIPMSLIQTNTVPA